VTVLVDTNVFTARLRPGSPLLLLYSKHLVGQRLAVAPQTVAEARYGAFVAGWGGPRLAKLDRLIVRARILPVDIETVNTVARLRNDCRIAGHPLHQKHHNGDLWVAATAVRWKIPLVAHDGVFFGCPGLDLRTEIETGP
jgi:predicted nucleic acid-binding protein